MSGPQPPLAPLKNGPTTVASRRFWTVEALIGLSLFITLAGLWGGVLLIDRSNHARATAEAMRTTANLARAFEEHAVRTLHGVDQILREMIFAYQDRGDRFDLNQFFLGRKLDPALYVSAVISSDNGDKVLSAPIIAEPLNLADREHVSVHAASDSGSAFVSKPVFARLAKRWSIIVTRRINGPDGRFAGVAGINIDPEYFRSFYGQVDVGDNGIIALSGRDGIVRARYNGSSREIGQDISKSDMFRMMEREPAGSLATAAQSDGVARYFSYRALKQFPLVISVGLTQAGAMGEADAECRALFAASSLLTLVLVISAWMLVVAVRRRKVDEKALAESRGRFHALLNGLPDRIWMKDGAGRYLALNDAHARAIGRSAHEVIGKHAREVVPVSHAAIVEAEDRDVLESRSSVRIDRQSLTDAAKWEDIVKVPVLSPQGEVTSIVAAARDISKRVEAERKARAGEMLLSRLMETTEEGFWFIDNDLKTVDVNPAMCALLGRRREEIVGQDIFAFVDEENAAIFRAEVAKRKLGQTGAYEIALLRPDGTEVRCVNNATPLFNDEGVKFGSVGLWTDVGPLKEAQRQIEAARMEAVAASDAKTNFLSTMSHEIRTPLAGILGMAELLQGTALTAEQLAYCQTIASSGSALHDLLGNILDMNKIDAGKLQFESVDFNLTQLLNDLSLSHAGIAAARKNQFLGQFSPGLPERVRGDPTRLRQVLINLLGNANKFTEGGKITFAVSQLPDVTQGTGVLLRFSVRDTGIGIEPEKLAGLFQPFAQADGSTTRRFGGSGLGLVICRNIVALMGGSLRVESSPGSGTHFWCDIPFRVTAQAQAPAQPAPGPLSLSASVLLAEDRPIIQEIISTLLAKAGARVQVVENGELAVQAMAKGSFDVVLMDCQMPVMSGFDAAKLIRMQEQSNQGRRIPIIALTANAFADNREACFAAGMDDFLTKPVKREVLIQTIARWAGNGGNGGNGGK